jgi:hypothetical protein
MKPNNKWLKDEYIIDNIEIDISRLYLQDLCYFISNFLYSVPLKVVTAWDINNKGIIFFIGDNRRLFELDENISKYDFITLVKNWLVRFFPKYEVEIEKTREFTSSEIIQIRKECINNNRPFNLNDHLNKKIKYSEIEKGMITKINLIKDQFIIDINGVGYLCAPGSTKIPIRLSDFMNTLRKMKISHKPDKDIYDFIKLNSFVLRKLKEKKITINYKDRMMVNFFKINFKYISKNGLLKTGIGIYESGKYIIDFEGDSYLEKSCLEGYQKRMELIN